MTAQATLAKLLQPVTPVTVYYAQWPLILWVNLPFINTNHPECNKFVTGAKTKATGDSKLNDSCNT